MDQTTDTARKADCQRRAWLVAMSGQVSGWQEVERILIGRGWPDAPRFLEDPVMRAKLDAVCAQARAAAPPKSES